MSSKLAFQREGTALVKIGSMLMTFDYGYTELARISSMLVDLKPYSIYLIWQHADGIQL